MTGTLATSSSAAFRPSPPRGISRSIDTALSCELGQLATSTARHEANAPRRESRLHSGLGRDRGEHRV